MQSQRSHVVVNGRFLSQPLTGVQRYGRELLRALDAMPESFPIEVLTPRDARESGTAHLTVRRVGIARGYLWEQFELPLAARGQLLFNPANIGPLLGSRMVTTVHSLAFLHEPATYTGGFRTAYRVLVPAMIGRSRTVITPSAAERERILAAYSVEPARVTVVPLGVDHSRFFPDSDGKKRERGAIVVVGSRATVKNLAAIMQAFADVAAEVDATLLVVGGAMPTFAWRGATLPALVNERIQLLGHIEDDSRLRRIYSQATMLVLASHYESFGLPALEAMACGCPVVASRIPALVELCGDAAEYCESRDVMDIARAILTVWRDEGRRARLAAAGIDRARAFSWARTASLTLEVLASALKS